MYLVRWMQIEMEIRKCILGDLFFDAVFFVRDNNPESLRNGSSKVDFVGNCRFVSIELVTVRESLSMLISSSFYFIDFLEALRLKIFV